MDDTLASAAQAQPELHLQAFLRAGGTPADLAAQFSIKAVRHGKYPNLILFKYSQVASDMSLPIVQESRGIILDADDDWCVVSQGFSKFFNHLEPNAAEIDWATARVQEKVDGSLCTLYEYRGRWHVTTTGSPDASGTVGSNVSMTFEGLFWECFSPRSSWAMRHKGLLPGDGAGALISEGESRLDPDLCFMFELTSRHNRVVVPHTEQKLTLLAARNRVTGEWLNNTGVREYPLQSFADILATFGDMNPLAQEGYVVVDGRGNRVKVKHPGYVALHHMRDGLTQKSMLEVIQRGEVPEVITHFPELADAFNSARGKFDALAAAIDCDVRTIKETQHDGQFWTSSPKDFAAMALTFSHSAALFAIRAKKVHDGRDFLSTCQVSTLMRLLGLKENTSETPPPAE